MRVVVNAIATNSGGGLSILKSFYDYLLASEDKEIEWIFLLSDYSIEETKNIKVNVLEKVKKNRLCRLIFDLFEGKRYISKLEPDVVFSLQNTITFGLRCPQVLYLHQSIPFQNEKNFSFIKKDERNLAIYQHIIGKIIKKSIKQANKVVVQTEWIKNAVIEKTAISSEKIAIIQPPMPKQKLLTVNDTLLLENNFFYPAANSVYKNHECIYKANDILIRKKITDYNISLTIENEKKIRNISFYGNMNHQEVMRKYNSSILVFPSYLETLGLPLLEAKSAGAVILAADCLYSREVLNDYPNVYFFNPFNPEELASLMEKIISGKIEKKRIIRNDFSFLTNSWSDVVSIISDNKGGSL